MTEPDDNRVPNTRRCGGCYGRYGSTSEHYIAGVCLYPIALYDKQIVTDIDSTIVEYWCYECVDKYANLLSPEEFLWILKQEQSQ